MKEVKYMTKQQLIEQVNQLGDNDKIFYLKIGRKTEMMQEVTTIGDKPSIPRDTSKYKMVNTLK